MAQLPSREGDCADCTVVQLHSREDDSTEIVIIMGSFSLKYEGNVFSKKWRRLGFYQVFFHCTLKAETVLTIFSYRFPSPTTLARLSCCFSFTHCDITLVQVLSPFPHIKEQRSPPVLGGCYFKTARRLAFFSADKRHLQVWSGYNDPCVTF